MPNTSVLIDWRKRWNQSLLQFLSRRVRASADVEDLAQETYLRLLRARDLRDVRNPQAYLLRVADHVVRDWWDSRSRAESLTMTDESLLMDECLPELELDAANRFAKVGGEKRG